MGVTQEMLELQRERDRCFDYVVNYVISLVSLTLTAELYASGTAGRYAPRHQVSLDAKQLNKRLLLYPHVALDDIFQLRWPSVLAFDEEPIEIPPSAILELGALERPLLALEQAMIVNYFERGRVAIEQRHGNDPKDWPSVWNFARVVRNSVAHRNEVSFRNARSQGVSWRGLEYSPEENGRRVLNGDLWAADLIYLMLDLDEAVPS